MAFTAGGGCGINDVKKVETKHHTMDMKPGLGGSGGGASTVGVASSVFSSSGDCSFAGGCGCVINWHKLIKSWNYTIYWGCQFNNYLGGVANFAARQFICTVR